MYSKEDVIMRTASGADVAAQIHEFTPSRRSLEKTAAKHAAFPPWPGYSDLLAR
jgi:hypothetical protein